MLKGNPFNVSDSDVNPIYADRVQAAARRFRERVRACSVSVDDETLLLDAIVQLLGRN